MKAPMPPWPVLVFALLAALCIAVLDRCTRPTPPPVRAVVPATGYHTSPEPAQASGPHPAPPFPWDIFFLETFKGFLVCTGLIVWADEGQTAWRKWRAHRAFIQHLGRP